MAGPCQNNRSEGAGVENGRRWDEGNGKDGPKWPASARIRGGESKLSEKQAETDLNGRPLPK